MKTDFLLNRGEILSNIEDADIVAVDTELSGGSRTCVCVYVCFLVLELCVDCVRLLSYH